MDFDQQHIAKLFDDYCLKLLSEFSDEPNSKLHGDRIIFDCDILLRSGELSICVCGFVN